MAILGIIGGLGPMATVYFTELITAMTEAYKDQDHLKMIAYYAPDIPDRTEFILGKSTADPVKGITEAGLALKTIGADFLAIPCITAHCFHNEIESNTGLKVLHAIRETADLLVSEGVKSVGLMATEGTVQCKVFQNELVSRGIEVILPSEEMQKRVTSLIYSDIKCGKKPDMDDFFAVKTELRKNGAEVVILGCTELSLIKRSYSPGDNVLDVLEVLAKAAVTVCGHKVREQYNKLITAK